MILMYTVFIRRTINLVAASHYGIPETGQNNNPPAGLVGGLFDIFREIFCQMQRKFRILQGMLLLDPVEQRTAACNNKTVGFFKIPSEVRVWNILGSTSQIEQPYNCRRFAVFSRSLLQVFDVLPIHSYNVVKLLEVRSRYLPSLQIL